MWYRFYYILDLIKGVACMFSERLNLKGKKVLVLMSGGVDSSVSALILKKSGCDVTGATMVLSSGDSSVNSDLNVKDAKMVADFLNIKHIALDLRDKFGNDVINYFCNEYMSGKTPNPCVMCNKKIKFGEMLKFAKKNGFDYIASGHYAKVSYDENLCEWTLKKSVQYKDQSYVLYNLKNEELKFILFPIGVLNKTEVRKIARENNLPVSEKPESQDICFIREGDHVDFIKKRCKIKKLKQGHFLDSAQNVLGTHEGIIKYTIGQRRGLGISLGKTIYVTNINSAKNTVTLGEESELFSNGLIASEVNIISKKLLPLNEKINAKIKIRYKSKEIAASILVFKDENSKLTAKVNFEEPVKSVTNGQSAVFYKNDTVLGGGVIKSRF